MGTNAPVPSIPTPTNGNLPVWAKGLLAAVVGGLSNGFLSGLTLMGVSPTQYNLSDGLRHTMVAAGSMAVVSSLTSAALYLKQSPVPNGK